MLSQAQTELRRRDNHKLTLGASSGDYFWPGLPDEQAAAWSFFQASGFEEDASSGDLIQELDTFQVPAWVTQRLISSGASLVLADYADERQVIAFERLYFPAWAPYFESEFRQESYRNILVAKSADGQIVGTLLMNDKASLPWDTVSRNPIGTLNTVGVAHNRQGHGIGLALTAGAMEHLRERGCSQCLIQWTGLAEWYGKLGAKRWAQYHMAHKILQ